MKLTNARTIHANFYRSINAISRTKLYNYYYFYVIENSLGKWQQHQEKEKGQNDKSHEGMK